MRRQLVPGPVVRLTVIKAKTRPGIEAKSNTVFCKLLVIMPRCACASEVYGSLEIRPINRPGFEARYTVVCFLCVVCVSVCLCRLLQLLKDESSASKSFYRLLVMFTWILIRGFAK